MKKLLPISLTVIFLLALLSFTVTYSVRFTEAAVVTTFGKADKAPIEKPGLRLKWPYPIQTVTKYDTRMRLLQSRAEAQQTSDDRQIIVEAFVMWRVADPLKFFQRFSNAGGRAEDHYEAAERTLKALLAGAMAETGKYALSDLFTPVPGGSKLADLESQILATLEKPDESGKSISDYGVQATGVGIYRVRLAEQTTTAVNDRIAANRDRLAKEIESAGDAEAEAIKSKAEADRQRILAFAERRAQLIRAEGDIAAAEFVGQMNTHPDLAVFLKNLDFMSKAFSPRTTVILSTEVPGMNLIDPDALSTIGPGGLPTSNMPQAWRKAQEEAQDQKKDSDEEGSR